MLYVHQCTICSVKRLIRVTNQTAGSGVQAPTIELYRAWFWRRLGQEHETLCRMRGPSILNRKAMSEAQAWSKRANVIRQ